ncbi:hypothetical protein SEA_ALYXANDRACAM_57 [Microbacterium phage Alyxandracam]|uniref:Uncharacterized protein n=1 Tax=Microbacterium phage Alyxandracam TaxID=2590933 RepID=A0A516KTK4_9CAUD|nr:hypothetical protein SEA_ALYXANDRACAM_57 [Microbacterium phage Alyxandracam]
MNEVWRELTLAQASSLWTFGRATPVDGDKLALHWYYQRTVGNYFREMLAEIDQFSNNLLMNNTADTFESLLARMAELTWMPLDARERFDDMLRSNFNGSINDED